MTRAAILLATAAAAAGCGKEAKTGPDSTETTTDAGGAMAKPDAGMMVVNPYGVPLPPPDAAPPPPKATDQGNMAAPAYGVPPPNLVPKKK